MRISTGILVCSLYFSGDLLAENCLGVHFGRATSVREIKFHFGNWQPIFEGVFSLKLSYNKNKVEKTISLGELVGVLENDIYVQGSNNRTWVLIGESGHVKQGDCIMYIWEERSYTVRSWMVVGGKYCHSSNL